MDELNFLEQAISDWEKAQKIRLFAYSMEKTLNEVSDEVKKQKILKWIEWSKNKADWLDPLIAKPDELLGANKHIFDLIIEDDI